MDLKNKTVWITGASSGLGEALAYAYCLRGATIILSSRNKQELERVRGHCKTLGGNAVVETLDLSKPDELIERAETIQKNNGPIDILINNGGVSQRSAVVDTNPKVDQAIMQINFMGTISLTKVVLPFMIKRNSGHIVVISSVMGKFAAPNNATYVASKHALQGYFDALRAEVDRFGLKVTIVCPGFVKTNVSINALTSDGTPHNKMDRGQDRGMSAEACAKKIMKAVDREREEITIGGLEIAGVYLKRWFPGVVSKVIKRIKR
ncbi:MAG: SDR family oxidoreductase [Balneolales bacterium]